jgi:hypothetical protein
MFWRALWSELRVRLLRPFLAAATIIVLTLTIVVVITATDRSLPPEAIPIRLVLLPLVITGICSVAAWQWLRAPRPQLAKTICQSCGFSLAGHLGGTAVAAGPQRCPECGADPAALTSKHIMARRIVLAIGWLMMAWSVLSLLLAFTCLRLWSGLDV